jgi:hypothetical protein
MHMTKRKVKHFAWRIYHEGDEPARDQMISWCWDLWGPPGDIWMVGFVGWYFKLESDAVLFLLTWS